MFSFSSCNTDKFFAPQTSSYGGRASEKGKPDLQRRRKASSGIVQPGGEEKEREQDPVELQGDGVQENQRQGGEVNDQFVSCYWNLYSLFGDMRCKAFFSSQFELSVQCRSVLTVKIVSEKFSVVFSFPFLSISCKCFQMLPTRMLNKFSLSYLVAILIFLSVFAGSSTISDKCIKSRKQFRKKKAVCSIIVF